MQTSANGRNLIEGFEGLRLTSYQDQRGIWTVGYGHTGPDVYPGLTISQPEADDLLAVDLHHAETAIYKTVQAHLTQNQFDAVVSLVYNIGGGAFSKSTVLRLLNLDDYEGAAIAFLMWDKTNGEVNLGLQNRRQAEKLLFLTPEAA